jgi:hypothetical protein
MPRTVLGIRVHSGWAALVAVSGRPPSAIDVAARARVVCIDPAIPGARQPYHYVERMELGDAEAHLEKCAAASGRMALAALRHAVRGLNDRDYGVTGAAILLAAGRPLPSLARILASHAFIHTAEGEFFRAVFRSAFADLGIPVTGIRERDLGAATPLHDAISGMGRSLGPPWTADQKNAALAACLVLNDPPAPSL